MDGIEMFDVRWQFTVIMVFQTYFYFQTKNKKKYIETLMKTFVDVDKIVFMYVCIYVFIYFHWFKHLDLNIFFLNVK